MSQHSNRFTPDAPAGLHEENALLRASLAEAQQRIAELEQLAEADPLTGVANARRFRRELERVVGQAGRHGTPAAVLHIDVRGLKAINDSHGRFAGDAALRHVARLTAGLIRSTDVLARLDGDVFGLVLDHLDADSAIDTGERIARCIASDPVDLGPTSIRIEAAVAATGILAGDGVEEVQLRADRNLARVKNGG